MASIDYHNLLFQIRLNLIPRIGCINAKKLVSYIGSVEAIFEEKKKVLLKIPGIGEHTAQSIVSSKNIARAEQEIEFVSKNKIQPLFYLNDDYPARLKYCEDGPLLIYCKGNMNLNHTKVVSIVGTRNATDYGKKVCQELIEGLGRHDCLVVSGLAYGIDICAHMAALNNKVSTVGVVAHGLDRIYPRIHENVADKMLEQGGLITEFMSETNPDRENFPKRNRIIAGLADAVIVIESGPRGGSLITADIANSYDREVLAYPGKSTDKMSTGCNWLIKRSLAASMENIADLELLMQWEKESKKVKPKPRINVKLSEEERVLVDLIKEKGKYHIDELTIDSKIAMNKTSALLINLEFSGVVKSLPGRMYVLN
ncbi:MAG: DNA-protecting protein DprA [Flavobacteriales bacterium]|nr:DNA-protecting protein DprA [Flavobacteriales bacterium]